MPRTGKLYNVFGILLVLFLIPFLLVTQYTYLAADDFCRTGKSFSEYLQNFPIWYSQITGRYFNYFLVYLPLYKLSIYKMVLGCTFLLLGASSFYFVKKIISYFNFNFTPAQHFLVAALTYLGIIVNLPSLYEFFYWYAATSVYLVSAILFLLLLGKLISQSNINLRNFIILSLLIIMLNGNNEMFLILNSLILLLLAGFKYFQKKRLDIYTILLNVVNWISVFLVISSPASAARQSNFEHSGEIIFSVINALLSTGMLLIKKSVAIPNILLFSTIFLLLYSSRSVPEKRVKILNPITSAIISFILLATVLVVPYYATGGLNVNRGRIGNLIQFLVFIFMFLNLVNLTVFLKRRNIKFLAFKNLWMVTLLGFLFYTGFFNKNFKAVFSDLTNGELTRYARDIQERDSYLQGFDEQVLKIKKIKAPQGLQHWEVSIQKEDWSYECYKDYLYRNYEIKMDSLIIESP